MDRHPCTGLAYLVSSINLHLTLLVMALASKHQQASRLYTWRAGLYTLLVLFWLVL